MNDLELHTRLMNIEMVLDRQQKELDDLSDVVIKQGKMLDYLTRQSKALQDVLDFDVKPQSEETPPPHY